MKRFQVSPLNNACLFFFIFLIPARAPFFMNAPLFPSNPSHRISPPVSRLYSGQCSFMNEALIRVYPPVLRTKNRNYF